MDRETVKGRKEILREVINDTIGNPNAEKYERHIHQDIALKAMQAYADQFTQKEQWVRVDTPPEEGVRVLVLTTSGYISIGFFYKGVWERNEKSGTFAGDGYTLTHWMPLPPTTANS